MRLLIFLLTSLSLNAQIIPLFFYQNSTPASCGTPVLTTASGATLKFWYSADCMTAISPCATSYSDGHTFITNDHWQDRSGNNRTATIDASEPACVFKLNEINGLPAVSFGGGGSGPDGSGNCGWGISQPDVGATSWGIFVAWQGQSTTSKGDFLGPFTTAAGPGTFKYQTNDLNTTHREQGLDKSEIALVGDGTATSDLNWHQLNIRFSNQADQNTLIFRLDEAPDGTSTPNATINTTNGGIGRIGIEKSNGTYLEAITGRMEEIFGYAGTGVLLTAGEVTTNETYLRCRIGH